MSMVAEDHYRLCVVRSATVARPEDLRTPLDLLLAALPLKFFGTTTALEAVPVTSKEDDTLRRFLESAALSNPAGRAPTDPTHEVRFFTQAAAPDAIVDLHLTWGGQPGFVAELRLGRDAAPPPRTSTLRRLFDTMVKTFRPDFAFIDLPRRANAPQRPGELVFGWATYVTRRWPVRSVVPPPGRAIEVPYGGTVLLATIDLKDEFSADVVAHVEAIEKFARPILGSPGTSLRPPPPKS